MNYAIILDNNIMKKIIPQDVVVKYKSTMHCT
ncbi:MAG: hypothetical protein Ta2B_18050 [Termitinemataceae bacterium]|nr:MAG: hypothetical protein Ta2B_18050 [Termitinemataceae bacterium]